MKLFINIIIALILLFKGVYTYSFADELIRSTGKSISFSSSFLPSLTI